MKQAVAALKEDKHDWLRYISALVVIHGMPVSEAWGTTLVEFWAFHNVWVESNGGKPERPNETTAFNTVEDVEAFETHLRELGAL